MDERCEHVADAGAVLCAVEERVTPVADGQLQRAFTNIVLEWRALLLQENR
jgi:hypothetical protein